MWSFLFTGHVNSFFFPKPSHKGSKQQVSVLVSHVFMKLAVSRQGIWLSNINKSVDDMVYIFHSHNSKNKKEGAAQPEIIVLSLSSKLKSNPWTCSWAKCLNLLLVWGIVLLYCNWHHLITADGTTSSSMQTQHTGTMRISSPLINNQTGELLLFVSWSQHGYVGCHVLNLWVELTEKLRLQFVVSVRDVHAVQSRDSREIICTIRDSVVFLLCCLWNDS